MNKVTTAKTLSYKNQPLENSTEITYISKLAKVSRMFYTMWYTCGQSRKF